MHCILLATLYWEDLVLVSIEDADLLVSLTEYSQTTGIPLDTLLALYLAIGKDIFLVFSLFQDRTIKFPKTKSLKASFNTNVRVLELSAKQYRVGGVWKKTLDLSVGDIIEVGSHEIAIVLPVQEVLGHYYTLLVQ